MLFCLFFICLSLSSPFVPFRLKRVNFIGNQKMCCHCMAQPKWAALHPNGTIHIYYYGVRNESVSKNWNHLNVLLRAHSIKSRKMNATVADSLTSNRWHYLYISSVPIFSTLNTLHWRSDKFSLKCIPLSEANSIFLFLCIVTSPLCVNQSVVVIYRFWVRYLFEVWIVRGLRYVWKSTMYAAAAVVMFIQCTVPGLRVD